MLRRAASLFVGLALLLAGCATTRGFSAAPDVHALLVAIRDDDRATFDAHVDRRALEAEMQAIIVERSRALGGNGAAVGLGLLLSGPVARAAGDVLIRPDVFRAIADYYGYRPDTPIPGPLSLAIALTPLPDGRVCAKGRKGGPCLLIFADEGGTWRLVGFDASQVNIGRSGGWR
jgi:predicted small secreted protein